jgi:hypothetical protein
MPESEEEFEPITTACQAELRSVRAELSECEANPAPRAELRSCRAELVECEADAPVKPSQHQRKALSTPAPTPSVPVPSNTPSVSPAPTTEAWFQLAAAVESSNEEILVEENVMFPSQSPITIDYDRIVSIVGRLAEDGGRVTLDGLSDSRLFVVDGGSLYLTHLNLVNGTSPNPDTACSPQNGDNSCTGGAILVLDDGQLVMMSCDIRGRGWRDGEHFDAYFGGGVRMYGFGITTAFDNVTFEGLSSQSGAAVNSYKGTEDGVPVMSTFRHCQFLRNFVTATAVARFAAYDAMPYFYDCPPY